MTRIEEWQAAIDASLPTHLFSTCCGGEYCTCGNPATHKVEEAIFRDDLMQRSDEQPTLTELVEAIAQGVQLPYIPFRKHPLTAYICCDCFRRIMGRCEM